MKTTFSKLVLPMLVIVLAVTSAFTTVKNASADALLIAPHEQQVVSGVTTCVPKSQSCSLTVSGVFCRVGQQANNPRLYDMNANDECVIALYKP